MASHLYARPPRGCQQSLPGRRWRMSPTPRRAESRNSECAITGGPNALGAPVCPSTFPTGAFGRGRSQPWTPALSPRVPCPLLCSQVLPPPAAARLTGGATSAWHDRGKTNLSFPRRLQLQKLQATYWLAGGKGLLGLRRAKKRCNSAARSQPGWPAVAGGSGLGTRQFPVASARRRCALPGAPGGRGGSDCVRRGPEQTP